jgi:hypothetical protein
MNAQTKIETTLLGALAVALPTLEGAKKNAANPHLKSKYADLGSVMDAIRPIAEHGIWFLQITHENDSGAEVETLFIGHGEQISAGRVFVPASKRDAHGFGSALTYARRYGLQTAFGLATEDDDGHAAVKAPKADKAPLIGDADWALITQLVEATKTDAGKVCGAYGVDSLRALSSNQFKDLKAVLEKRLKDASVKEKADA